MIRVHRTTFQTATGECYGYTHFSAQLWGAAARLGVVDDPDAPVAVHLDVPMRFRPILGKTNVLFTMWESEDFPAAYRQNLAAVDHLLVPCAWNVELFRPHLRAGVPIDVVPLGVETDVFSFVPRQWAPPSGLVDAFGRGVGPVRSFQWLHVGSTNVRKGADVLQDAWNSWGWWRRGDCHLYVKVTGLTEQAAETAIHEVGFRPIADRPGAFAHPEWRVILDGRDLPRAALAKLYQQSHGFVLPSGGEGWGLCVDPSTMIQVRDGARPMSAIAAGDVVLGGDGLWRPVLAKTARTAPRLRVHVNGAATIVSPEHPYLRLPRRAEPFAYYERRDESPTWTRADVLRPGDWVAMGAPAESQRLPAVCDLAPIAAARGDLIESDRVAPRRAYAPAPHETARGIAATLGSSRAVVEHAREGRGALAAQAIAPAVRRWVARHVPWTDDVLELLGWYLAEGSATNGRVELSMHRREAPIADRLAAVVREAFGVSSTIALPARKNVCRLRFSSPVHAAWLRQMCGVGAAGKRLADFLVDRPRALGPLIRGLFLGDGHGNDRAWTLTTASTALAWQVRSVLAANGVIASVACRANNRGFATSRPAWTVRVGGEDARRLCAWAGLDASRLRSGRASARQTLRHGELLYRQVRRVEALEDGEVQDISVAGAHSFVGNGVVLHNTLHEAAATGLPVICTPYGGNVGTFMGDHFVGLEWSPYETESEFWDGRELTVETIRTALAHPQSLDAAMRAMMADYPAALARARQAAKIARTYTWERSALAFKEALRRASGQARRAA